MNLLRTSTTYATAKSAGGELMLNGRIYAITSEHLGAGVYRVSTKLAKAGGR